MKFVTAAAITALGMLSCNTVEAAVITGETADRGVNSAGGGNLAGSVNDTTITYGIASGSNSAVLVFELPNLTSDTVFSTANLSFRYQRTTDSQSNNGDLEGITARNSSTVLASDHSTPGSLIEDDIIVATLNYNSSRTANTSDGVGGGDENLTAYLNAQLAATAAERALGETFYVFLRLRPDSGGSTSFRRYYITSADAGTNQPTLTYETALVPEPSCFALVAIFGQILLSGRRTSRSCRRII